MTPKLPTVDADGHRDMLSWRLFPLRIFGLAALLALLLPLVTFAENVKIGIPSLTVTMMPLAVAKELGFFQREGLNVETVLMPAAMNIKVLLAGDIQYATTVGSAVVAAVRGVSARVVMCFVDRPLLDLVARPQIGSITDLKGGILWRLRSTIFTSRPLIQEKRSNGSWTPSGPRLSGKTSAPRPSATGWISTGCA